MSVLTLARPGPLMGERPERRQPARSWHERADHRLGLGLTRRTRGSFRRFRPILTQIRQVCDEAGTLSDHELEALRSRTANRLGRAGLEQEACIDAFALLSMNVQRVLGLTLHDEQLFAAWLLLHGFVAEMETGEGKTLTAIVAASTAALSGAPVHVITANDYLVDRDAGLATTLCAPLNLRVGAVLGTQDQEARRRAYGCDITYVSNKQVVFDYLRDQQAAAGFAGTLRARLSGLISGREQSFVQRGLCFAIVDEADSVLVDDARTPMVLSQPQTSAIPSTNYAVALGLARRLDEEHDYQVSQVDRAVQLTRNGEQRLQEMTRTLKGNWANSRYRRELVLQALTAIHLFHRDHHYLVTDRKVILIDEATGRVMPDRKLSHGLHQMVEIKEGCTTSGQDETVNAVSTQGFFRRYHQLSGLTGTAREVSGELQTVYGLPVVRVPLHRASQRRNLGLRFYTTAAEKHRMLVARVSVEHQAGRPVLIGTGSVAESEEVSALLERSGLENQVLNASQDDREAEIVAAAGSPSSILVATNMAGRGTDIPLSGKAAESGGLHVVSVHLNDARRIDRQLFGRCGRQGDPGSYEMLISLEDALFCDIYPEVIRGVLAGLEATSPLIWKFVSPAAVRWAQRRKERQHYRMRKAVLRKDEDLANLLAFSGREK